MNKILTLIILCVLTATAWGQENGATFYGIDLQFEASSGRAWQLVEDSTPVTAKWNYLSYRYKMPGTTSVYIGDIIGWDIFLTWRLVKEELESPIDEIETALTNIAKWDARLPDIEPPDTISYISDTVIDSLVDLGEDPVDRSKGWWCGPVKIRYVTKQFRIRCWEEPDTTWLWARAANRDIDGNEYLSDWQELWVEFPVIIDILKCDTTEVK